MTVCMYVCVCMCVCVCVTCTVDYCVFLVFTPFVNSPFKSHISYFFLYQIKDGTWRKTIVEVDTPKPYRLPVQDIAVYDIGDKGEEFGLEIGPVCFL